ncbi:MAG: hypothetical protein CO013_06540 [Syntrophobacterales bacterium CG_4_8_14_3_um_filter_58_8]|nr:MAG: hypothetical protein CO013_06540 [Syntrophobacterales bacterium CG_4_8_14_3_um_filter_58_8]
MPAGKPVTGINTDIGYMTQDDNLLPWRTLRDNVEVALEFQGVPASKRHERAAEYIAKVGLSGFENHYPHELSGGMRKQIDAFHLSAPTPCLAQRQGFGEVIIKASAGDVPELDNFLYTGVAVSKEYAEKNPDLVKRWAKAVSKANVLLRKDEAAALKYLKKYFPRMPDDVMALAMKEILPALSADGTMNEQMMQKHLDFLKDTKQVDSTPSGKEGVLWTNAYIK